MFAFLAAGSLAWLIYAFFEFAPSLPAEQGDLTLMGSLGLFLFLLFCAVVENQVRSRNPRRKRL